MMTRRIILTAIVLVLSCEACQSTLQVKVELLEGVHTRPNDGAIVETLMTIRDALEGLDEICTECRLTYGDETVEGSLAALAEAQRRGRALMPLVEELTIRQSRGEVGGAALAAQVRALHHRARDIMPKVDLDSLSTVIQIEVDAAHRAAMRQLADEIVPALNSCSGRLASASVGMPGFGGFRQGGVYQINPGDPAYERVLNAAAASMPISSVAIRADGDTGVMLVQESPAQLRLYQISNDPTSILRNAAFILNKVLQAAVKFSTIE